MVYGSKGHAPMSAHLHLLANRVSRAALLQSAPIHTFVSTGGDAHWRLQRGLLRKRGGGDCGPLPQQKTDAGRRRTRILRASTGLGKRVLIPPWESEPHGCFVTHSDSRMGTGSRRIQELESTSGSHIGRLQQGGKLFTSAFPPLSMCLGFFFVVCV